MRYLLDTNVVSDMVRSPAGSATKQLARVGQSQIGISIIVASELRYGLLRLSSFERARRTHDLLGRLSVIPFDTPADMYYAEIRATLEMAGTPIGRNDTLIAAHALALDCTLVTNNEREFRRVPGLAVENWAA
jgi:tRNA(fMet)-specific endonuclease VapC